ncbi:hypothetical protein INT47_006694 [Mucor saturninus]|uniref:Uncharacterized protein n=1 Tax=Mucor saturninus TaxID=64648 RepID=A0A8H7UXP4_9FUNG|nr:hypothetical protein INT47_006694 [Mucor saturninus]
MQVDMSDNTKSLKTFSIQLNPLFSLSLSQENHTENHGTTVWDSAKLLSLYLFDSVKVPTFEIRHDVVNVKNKKSCLELGSGCGLAGLVMASLGFKTTLTDLPSVIDRVLQKNSQSAVEEIQRWWHHLHHTYHSDIRPQIQVRALDWFNLPCSEEEKFNYILASDCIYEIQLVDPLLRCIRHFSNTKTIVLIAMERRDDLVVDGFIAKARALGFDASMVLKKLIQTHQILVANEDVEIWKLRLRG